MDRIKLEKEHKELVDSLIEKTRFVYSEDFYLLDEFEKQKFTRDKMATEAHLSSLSSLLWCKAPQINGVPDMLALGLIGSMFGGGGSFFNNSSSLPMPTQNETEESPDE